VSDNSGAKRVRRYNAERRKAGLVRVSVWVPGGDVARLKLAAAGMRAEAEAQLPTDGEPLRSKIFVPKLEPEEHRPDPGWAYLRIEEDELAFRLLAKANDAEWVSCQRTEYRHLAERHELPELGVWCICSGLPERLGLAHRVVATEHTR
jgi:hypothetical protein